MRHRILSLEPTLAAAALLAAASMIVLVLTGIANVSTLEGADFARAATQAARSG